jgi:hypothetical protein
MTRYYKITHKNPICHFGRHRKIYQLSNTPSEALKAPNKRAKKSKLKVQNQSLKPKTIPHIGKIMQYEQF